MQITRSIAKVTTHVGGSVAHLLEVFSQRSDVAEGDGGLGLFAVVADEKGLCGLVGDDAFFALQCHVSAPFAKITSGYRGDGAAAGQRTFFAFSESSDASIVMYLMPPILIPLEMTCLGSLLSEKEAAMAFRSVSETCDALSVLCALWSRGSASSHHPASDATVCGEAGERAGVTYSEA
jgi:hypothetical protein